MLVIAAGHSCHSKVGFLVGFLLGKLVCLDHSGAIKANNNQGGSFQVSSSLGVLGLMSEADDVFSNRNLLSSSWRQKGQYSLIRFSKREIVPVTGILSNYPELVNL